MAFESLTDKFKRIFKTLRGQSRLSEKNMEAMLKEVRIALLEADVNYDVVKSFIEEVKNRAIGEQVYLKLNPSQMVVKIVHDEIKKLLGGGSTTLNLQKNKPTVIMLVGLQGSGKTTSCGKLAYYLKNKLNKKVLLAACDVYRPAAIDQLKQIGKKLNVPVYSNEKMFLPAIIAKEAREKAFNEHLDVLIVDTAGRLQIDEPLMKELENIEKVITPDETLLLVDAMSGQDAINVANEFNKRLHLTGVFMSKLDGDARGGAALSIKYLTGLPIKFSGLGEKLNEADIFYPDRMADRILGMGDVMTLVEKVSEEVNEEEAKKAAHKMMEGRFTLDDMLKQMRQVKRLGSISGLLKLIPGMPSISDEQKEAAKKEMKVLEAVINSMTMEERTCPEILKNSRKIRIAKGSGTTSTDINRILRKFDQMKQMMKSMKQYKNTGQLPPGFNGLGM